LELSELVANNKLIVKKTVELIEPKKPKEIKKFAIVACSTFTKTKRNFFERK